MEGICFKLLYATFLSCYISTANIQECGPQVSDFTPIYSMYECPMSSGDFVQKLVDMSLSGPKECK